MDLYGFQFPKSWFAWKCLLAQRIIYVHIHAVWMVLCHMTIEICKICNLRKKCLSQFWQKFSTQSKFFLYRGGISVAQENQHPWHRLSNNNNKKTRTKNQPVKTKTAHPSLPHSFSEVDYFDCMQLHSSVLF